MSFFAAAGLTLFILILFTGIFLNFLGLPGTIVIFFDVLCYAMVTGFEQIGWQVIVLLLVAAVAAETIEFFWVVSEAPQQESSPRKSLKTVAVGAVAGGFLLTPFLLGPGAWIGFFFRRTCGYSDCGNFSAIQIKSASSNAESRYAQYSREERS